MKRNRLDALLDSEELDAVWFARPNDFAWLTGGDNVVDREGAVGVAAAGYDGDGVTVITNNIEAPRLRDEELQVDVNLVEFDWHEMSLADAVAVRSPTPAAADFSVPGLAEFDAGSLRQPLDETDVERYRELGEETATAVEAVCRAVGPETSERAVAGAVRDRLTERGIDSPVVLVGGEHRAQAYRHYTPTDAPLDGYALVSVTTEKWGLHASCTRTVAFDPPAWLTTRHEAAMCVEVSALAATWSVGSSGGTAGEVFEEIQAAYEDVGHSGEWRKHHQGGAAGYAGREWIATPGHEAPVELPMAYAWNPTVAGAKSEDTVLVNEDGFEVLTRTGDWPTKRVADVDGDVVIDRHVVLETGA